LYDQLSSETTHRKISPVSEEDFLLSPIMQIKHLLINCIFTLFTLASYVPTVKRGDCACTNGPDTRNCWTPGFDVSVDHYSRFPDTGKTVHVMTLLISDSQIIKADLAR